MVVTEEPVENIDILGSSEDEHETQSPENRIDDITDAELAINFITDNGIDETENEVNVGQYSSNDNSQSIQSTPDDTDIYLNEGDTKVDSLGRIHINYPRTGPVLVYNRNGIFHHQTMEGHANDFLPLFKASVSSAKTCIVCIVDNGPDMDPSNYVNEIYWGKLWKDSGADMIQCISYAAGQSAYNPIEHAWPPLSNCLTGVILPATLPDEELPPSKQNLSEEEREEKDAAMLDLAAERLASYWRNVTYDGHAVVPISILSRETNKIYDDHDTFVEAPLRDFNTKNDLKNLRKEFKFLTKHAVRRGNEFVIWKCHFFRLPEEVCSYCRHHPPNAIKTLNLLKKINGELFEPTKSSARDGHYHTFWRCAK